MSYRASKYFHCEKTKSSSVSSFSSNIPNELAVPSELAVAWYTHRYHLISITKRLLIFSSLLLVRKPWELWPSWAWRIEMLNRWQALNSPDSLLFHSESYCHPLLEGFKQFQCPCRIFVAWYFSLPLVIFFSFQWVESPEVGQLWSNPSQVIQSGSSYWISFLFFHCISFWPYFSFYEMKRHTKRSRLFCFISNHSFLDKLNPIHFFARA